MDLDEYRETMKRPEMPLPVPLQRRVRRGTDTTSLEAAVHACRAAQPVVNAAASWWRSHPDSRVNDQELWLVIRAGGLLCSEQAVEVARLALWRADMIDATRERRPKKNKDGGSMPTGARVWMWTGRSDPAIAADRLHRSPRGQS